MAQVAADALGMLCESFSAMFACLVKRRQVIFFARLLRRLHKSEAIASQIASKSEIVSVAPANSLSISDAAKFGCLAWPSSYSTKESAHVPNRYANSIKNRADGRNV